MDKKEFSKLRKHLAKTQLQMSQLLGVSLKAIQSFEQGWRNVPVHIERQTLFLVAMKENQNKKKTPCWVMKNCPQETARACPAREFNSGHLCWFINGTYCDGDVQKNWHHKMKLCRNCKVFKSMLPQL
jgi:DNA-binding XRE family transcriptional regulator